MTTSNDGWQISLEQVTRKARGDGSSVSRHRATLVISSDNETLLEKAKLLLELVHDRLTEIDEGQMQELIELAMSVLQPSPSSVALRQARRNVEAREAMLKEFGALTSEEVNDLAGSRANNRSALATRWRKEGRIFSVEHCGRIYFPTFQFDRTGKPLPIIAKVIEHLGVDEKGWQLALWFLTNNGWLGGRRPIDLLESDPDAVVDAAAQEAAADAF